MKQNNFSSRRKGLMTMVLLVMIGSTLTACGSASSPADAVTGYLEALAENDQSAAVASSCAAWEEQALAEGASFINVKVSLDNLSCQVVDDTETQATVTCSGKYQFSYDAGEDQELDLSGRLFSVIKENGEWRMCGYQ
ncbi:MAG: hypothetical protein P8Y37_06965 [Anaerolineales bacterium]